MPTRMLALAIFCVLGIASLIVIGRYAARDIGPVDAEQAQTISVVYHGNRYTASRCHVRVDLASNLVTATCEDDRAQVTPAPAYARANPSSWLDVRVSTHQESLSFSDCTRYGEIVQCEKAEPEPRNGDG